MPIDNRPLSIFHQRIFVALFFDCFLMSFDAAHICERRQKKNRKHKIPTATVNKIQLVGSNVHLPQLFCWCCCCFVSLVPLLVLANENRILLGRKAQKEAQIHFQYQWWNIFCGSTDGLNYWLGIELVCIVHRRFFFSHLFGITRQIFIGMTIDPLQWIKRTLSTQAMNKKKYISTSQKMFITFNDNDNATCHCVFHLNAFESQFEVANDKRYAPHFPQIFNWIANHLNRNSLSGKIMSTIVVERNQKKNYRIFLHCNLSRWFFDNF